MQALLAARLVTEGWSGSDIQKAALREGLGMTDVGEELWGPLGKITMQVCIFESNFVSNFEMVYTYAHHDVVHHVCCTIQ